MRRLLLTLALLVVFLVPSVCHTADLDFLQSVYPLQVPVPDENGIGKLAHICTVSSIGDGEWLTAAHCVAQYTTRRYYIAGDLVAVVKIDVNLDLAKLATRHAAAPALKVAETAPEITDPVIVAGYPLGFADVNVTLGTMSGYQLLEAEGTFWPYALFAVAGAPGNSGSPVLNTDREIVSVVQIGFARDTFSPQLGGVLYETLRLFLQS